MKRPVIAVYTMAKNEVEHVPRFAETTQGADLVVVTDTGSSDGTPEALRDHGIQVHTSSVVPWRFDTGSNCALCHVPADADICVKLDLDEVLVSIDGKHWREEIEQLWTDGIHRIRYWYTWSWYVPGKVPAVRFRTSNVHARSGFIWRHPGHAALCSTSDGKIAEAAQFEIHHYMVGKSRPNYMPLLQLAVRENRCPRTLFYLGREYAYRKMNEEAIKTLNEYLAHQDSRWKAERANAMRLIAISYENLGDDHQAFGWLMRAHTEYPNVKDIWWETLRHFHDRCDFLGGYWAGLRCIAITNRDTEWTARTERAWREEPYALLARCAWQIGKQDEAVMLLQQAFNIHPESQVARNIAEKIGLQLQ